MVDHLHDVRNLVPRIALIAFSDDLERPAVWHAAGTALRTMLALNQPSSVDMENAVLLD